MTDDSDYPPLRRTGHEDEYPDYDSDEDEEQSDDDESELGAGAGDEGWAEEMDDSQTD